MRLILLTILFSIGTALPVQPRTPPTLPSGRRVSGRHIVRLKPSVPLHQFDKEFTEGLEADPTASPDQNTIIHRYDSHKGAFNGYAGVFSQSILDMLNQDERIASIEEDPIGHIDAVQKSPPNWGLTRISERKLDLSQDYIYDDTAGSGITAYILDTGVDLKHPEFGTRISFGANYITAEGPDDLEGHGSHVAGIVASTSYGVAKLANIVAVKVCNQDGDCLASDIIAGLQYVVGKATKLKAVVNMSLGVDATDLLDDMVAKTVAAGIPVIVSAGNGKGADACLQSPRRSTAAFAIGAVDNTDAMASFSNAGKCVRMLAPGVDILSAAPNGGTDILSGTSQASPHVAGIAALYMASRTYASVDGVYQDLVGSATGNTVTQLRPNTINLLACSLKQ